MKTRLFIMLFIMIFALNSCDGKPVAHFKKTEHDFGEVGKNTTLTCTFNFINKGSTTLRIERIKAG